MGEPARARSLVVEIKTDLARRGPMPANAVLTPWPA